MTSSAARSLHRLSVAAVLLAAIAHAGAADEPVHRAIRVEPPSLARRVLHLPADLLELFHWPLKQALLWGESVRIDRRVGDAIVRKDDDDQAVAEPAADRETDFVWWDVYRHGWLEPAERVVDLGESLPALGRAAGLVAPHEAANVNVLDEVPDSTWFTNRVGTRPLGPGDLAHGPEEGAPPAPGELVVEEGKSLGTQPGFWVRDTQGRRYLLKFDPRGYPDLATGAELVSSRILYALGWNVARYDSLVLDPTQLVIAERATRSDRYERRRPLSARWIADVLGGSQVGPDGRLHAVASEQIPGRTKGGFAMSGVRSDDANDTVPHEDRRDLRGLRVVAAWLDHVDFRSGNTLDAFVAEPGDPQGRGHLVHYLVDLNGTLGSWGTGWKDPWMGHEYVTELWPALVRGVGLSHPEWTRESPRGPTIGYFESEHFEPERWKPIEPAPPFERATMRDRLWGARLVAAFSADDLRAVIATVPWSDPQAADELLAILRARQQTIARTYFDVRRVSPLDRPHVDGGTLELRDLGTWSGIADAERSRYRATTAEGRAVENGTARFDLARLGDADAVAIETSRDEGRTWSPPLRLRIADGVRVVGAEWVTR